VNWKDTAGIVTIESEQSHMKDLFTAALEQPKLYFHEVTPRRGTPKQQRALRMFNTPFHCHGSSERERSLPVRTLLAMNPLGLNRAFPLSPPPYIHGHPSQRMPRRQEPVLECGQDLRQLINDALAVQDGLNSVKDQLASLDSAENTVPLMRLALNCQEVSKAIIYQKCSCTNTPANDKKFYDLLMSSRDSASILMAYLDGDALPLDLET
jgi:hypothetical protein